MNWPQRHSPQQPPQQTEQPQQQISPVTAAIDRALHALATGGPDLIAQANRIGEILWEPPRVVVIGRLKAGKSTLVNALVGQRVAATAAVECTNVVSVFRKGAPARAEVVGLDGSRQRVPLSGSVLLDAGRPVTEIAYVDRFLPNRAIENITLVDTPGTATLTVENEQATKRALIDGFDQTRKASVGADAALYLFDSAPRSDEHEFLAQLGFTPFNTLGVLSRADSFAEGALGETDALELAAQYADTLAGRLGKIANHVIPLSGLLAETAATGQITEADARALAQIADVDAETLVDDLESESPRLLSAPVRDRLLDLVGEYGVLHGREVAAQGARALWDWLVQRSGIQRLGQLVHEEIMQFAELQRAMRIQNELDALAISHPQREFVANIARTLAGDPAMTRVRLFRTLRSMLSTVPNSALVPIVTDLIAGRSEAEQLGLEPGADREAIGRRARDRNNEIQRLTVYSLSAVEEEAAGIVRPILGYYASNYS